ncbi:TPA: CPBP family intramembrane glutamic endopeptidase [Streptococcus suis]
MIRKRMFDAVRISNNKWQNWLYAIVVIVLIYLFIEVGRWIGQLVVLFGMSTIPSHIIQFLFYNLDPLFVQLIVFLFIAIILFIWVKFIEKRPIRDLGLYRKKAFVQLLLGWLIGVAMISTVVGLQLVTKSLQISLVVFTSASFINLLGMAPFWFIQSGTEELLTRGWLFPTVSRKTNLLIGTAVSSLLFSMLHIQNPSISWISLVNIGLFGLLASLYVLVTDNIWGISALHAAWNCFQGNFYGLSISGIQPAYSLFYLSPTNKPDYLTGGLFGPEGSIYSSLVMIVVIILLSIILWRKKEVV